MARLCSSRFERAARKLGWTRIAGLDEAGRGALFGSVVAAAVILNPKRRIVGLDDSKKLAAERRIELAERIREHAVAWAVAEIDAQRIDAWNIYQASRQAMTAALQQLSIQPDYLTEIVDIVGPVCETGDFFARDREIRKLDEGDLLAILDAGAYGMALASNYNTRPRPAEVLVELSRSRLIRKRESVRDLMAPERV